MDYHSIHGHDVSSFDIAGTHRLPTVQASQALNELQDDGNLYLSTGLEELDQALLPPTPAGSPGSTSVGGIKRGQITEIWGPSGTGKTAVSIQLAANSIHNGNDVVWIDCFQEMDVSRLEKVLSSIAENAVPDGSARAEPPAASRDGKPGPKSNKGPTASTKRLQGLQFIINALQKVAATKNCAVVVSSQCATRMQSEHGATLVPAVNASVWEQGISTRIVMFRDWAWKNGALVSIFVAGLQKLDGKSGYDAIERVAAFNVTRTGIARVECDASNAPVESADVVRGKRKLEQTDLEVPDSQDDEDYGWADDDEAALPAPPPQWQGSEDVLLGQELGRGDDGRDEEEDGCEGSHTPSSEATY
ncbi:DNA recombination/repair protein RecA/RadB, ATP-binding domain protein, partial [Metarhizium hybridum]